MHRFIPVLAKQAGFRRIGEKVVGHRARKYGVSKFGWERMIKGYLDLITVMFMTRFGKSPMYFFGGLGTLMFLLGGATAVYLIAEKLYKQAHGLLVRGVTDEPLLLYCAGGGARRRTVLSGRLPRRADRPQLGRPEPLPDRRADLIGGRKAGARTGPE